MAGFDAAVRESQARRWVVYPALRNGAYYPWDFQPLQKASERYMRNHMNLDNPAAAIADTRDGGTPNPNAGMITSGTGSRTIQLGLKLLF